VIEDEGLQANAAHVSAHLQDRMRALRHPLLAETRNAGLFFAAEFVTDAAITPASAFTAALVEAMLQRGILLNRGGRAANALKIRPPMPFSIENADMLMDNLEAALTETPVPHPRACP
jgi:4-aminobutyrate aminotransferase-like enzyme